MSPFFHTELLHNEMKRIAMLREGEKRCTCFINEGPFVRENLIRAINYRFLISEKLHTPLGIRKPNKSAFFVERTIGGETTHGVH